VEALATEAGYSNSAVASAAYTISAPLKAAKPTFSPGSGTYYQPQTVTLNDATPGVTIYYTVNGGTQNTCPSIPCSVTVNPATVTVPATIAAYAGGTGFKSSATVQRTYMITARAPSFSPGAGTYLGARTVTINDEANSPGATIYYTTNGTTPTSSNACTPLNSPPCTVTVATSETLEAVAAYDSTLLSESSVKSAIYTIDATPPTFSPGAGTYTTAKTVTLADATPGVTICYTLDGSTPTVTSAGACGDAGAGTVNSYTVTGPITVSATTTIEAVAGGNGYAQSALKSATYTINP